jgi:hypothetical protein
MDVPPSRYRVVERGRRLIVLDTHNGNAPVVRTPPPEPAQPRREALAPSRQTTPEDAAADLHRSMQAIRVGKADPVFETQSWYDDKAPRRVRLKQGGGGGGMGVAIVAIFIVAMIGFVTIGWPLLVVGGFLLLQSGTRKAFRRWVTRWLDGQEAA